MIDLHTHSNRSDGSDPPERIPELAHAVGCTAVALTDHDRLDGVEAARRRAGKLGIELVGGCEVSCATPFGTLHLLAYFVEEDGGPLHNQLQRLQQWRAERNARLAARLAELGLPVSLEEMEAEAGGVGVGRPHVAAILVRKGVVSSIQEAFDEWLADGRPAHVERPRLGLVEAVRLVRASGGVPVVAHPLSLHFEPGGLDLAVQEMAGEGVAGLEAIYGRYTPAERTMLSALARRHDLVVTGGSDYHGTYKPDLEVGIGRGDLIVPPDVLADLDARRPARA
ncbi:MAG: PHP domain-containing protein [Actinomycetota bacterium]|nr:PHP domain-containing protein [Actinomycetota bacterium]